MHRKIVVLLFLLGLAWPAQDAFAKKDSGGEGYAKVNFKELSQTLVALGGLDISDKVVATEYAKLIYCDLYKKNFSNDIEWGKIEKRIVTRILEKKESFRVLYEIVGIFNLDKYDLEHQVFPFTQKTLMKNVGTLVLIGRNDFQPYCGVDSSMIQTSKVFFPRIDLLLNQPLNVDKVGVPIEDAQRILARMEEAKNKDRYVYGRIRLRVTGASGPIYNSNAISRMELLGDVTAIDFFLDSEMSAPIGSVTVR